MTKIKLMYVLFSGLFLVHICGYAMDQKSSPVGTTVSKDVATQDAYLCAWMDRFEEDYFGDGVSVDEPSSDIGVEPAHDQSIAASSTSSSSTTTMPANKKSVFVGDATSKDVADQEADLCTLIDRIEADYSGDEPLSDLGIEPVHGQPVVASSSSSSSTATVPVNKKSAFGINGIMQCYISSRDNISAYLIDYINAAQSSIYIAMYQLRAMDIARALARAKVRGLDVWVICDHCTKDDRAIQFLITCGIKVFVWNTDRQKAIMHHKFALIDGDIVWNGSYNWTLNANNNNCENVMVVKNKEMYDGFFDEFCDELLPSSSRLQITQDPDQQNLKKRKRDETGDDVH